jgi:hypothetical protein
MITIAEAKSYMGVTITTNDVLIGTLIDYVTAEIEAVCGRNLMQKVYTDEVLKYNVPNYDAQFNPELDLNEDNKRLFLKNFPVQSLSLKENGVVVSVDNYILDSNNGVIELFTSPSDYKNNLKATYTAGYVVTGTSFVVPNDLKMIALQGVKYEYAYSGTVLQGQSNVQAKSTGAFSVTYNKDNTKPLQPGATKPYLAMNTAIINKYLSINL